jgi:UDP-N-acetylmuramoylalanine--D-glutamate ligase
MKIGLVGWGVETKSVYRYYGVSHTYFIVSEEPLQDAPIGENVTIQTLQEDRPVGLTSTVTDLSYLEGVEQCELIIYTSTARKNLKKKYAEDSDFWSKAYSTIELFFQKCPSKNTIGVTGTKGKGTTSTLIASLLQNAGLKVHLGGNIGIPVFDLLPTIQTDDWVVLELSSFQLYKLPYSPHIAVHLMMVPEHIEEWHKTMEDYVESKRMLFANQNRDDIAIFNPNNSYSSANVQASAGLHIPYLTPEGAYVQDECITIDGQKILPIKDVGLRGKHNIENICAALTAAWQVAKKPAEYAKTIREFTGLEHRLQLIREVNNVQFYDDSFGTTPDTAIVALDAFSEPKVIIVGGHDKGNDFTGLIERLQNEDVKHIVAIGITGESIVQQLLKNGVDSSKITRKENPNDWTMQEIVLAAQANAEAGDIVLLSTGSASFGIFKDYKDRGKQYIAVVNQL